MRLIHRGNESPWINILVTLHMQTNDQCEEAFRFQEDLLYAAWTTKYDQLQSFKWPSKWSHKFLSTKT